MTNHYHILGLSEDASQTEIKSAYKKLAIKYHPDKNPSRPEMEEKFKEINVAYQILSDEYKKARFDFKLKYRQFSEDEPRPYSYQPSSVYQWRTKNQTVHKKVDYHQNAIATIYAFGIIFIIALFVMTGVWVKKSYDNHKLEKLLAKRRSTYMDARKYFEEGNYKSAFETMTSLDIFRIEEQDMRIFKNTLLHKSIEVGDIFFENKEYENAIRIYELIQEFAPHLPLYEAKKKLAESYRYTNQPEKAISVLKKFLINEHEIISALIKIAEIYQGELNNSIEALNHLLIAHRLAIKRYKTFYGKGYSMVIKEEYLPKSHYYLYTNLAEAYLDVDDPKMAIKAADWNKYVWPDSASSYVTSARAYTKMGQNRKACIEYARAKDRHWSSILPIFCD